ncbi:MAG: thiamine-phosphate kinase [Lentisphaerales bacterium]|nr:thiamine-phosphate kinase [Lentisphaerales bacterium]
MCKGFSEDSFLKSLFPKLNSNNDLLLGPGDDCAVFSCGEKSLVIGVDQVIEGRHYLAETAAVKVGRKLLARNLSDIAAMGATPKFALLASASSSLNNEDWLVDFHSGLLDMANEYGVCLIGGDLAVTNNESVASLTIIGEVSGREFVTRGGAEEGDVLYATGYFGNSFLSEHHLNFVPRVEEGEWLKEFGVTAMMDVTDGLLQDATKLSGASQLNLVLDEAAVLLRSGADVKSALCEGEDYELIFTLSKERESRLKEEWAFEVPITKIGTLDFDGGVKPPVNSQGEDLQSKYGKGFDHFDG